MIVLKRLALVLLVALWVPATSHCLLASLSGIESLECCSQESTDCPPCHESECADDVCTTVEAGFYKTETVEVAAPQPLLSLKCFQSTESRLALSEQTARLDSVRPEFRPLLHFRTRAALPARAPTLPC